VNVVRSSNESLDVAVHANLFEDFANGGLFECFARVELALGKGPVTASLTVDTSQFNMSGVDGAVNNSTRRSNEIIRGIAWDDQLATQEIHILTINAHKGQFVDIPWYPN